MNLHPDLVQHVARDRMCHHLCAAQRHRLAGVIHRRRMSRGVGRHA